MEKSVIKEAKSVDEAINEAIAELGVSKDMCTIEILSEAGSGILGFGAKAAKVKVIVNEEEEEVYYGDDENFEGEAEITEAEEAAVNFIARVLSELGIHGNMDSYREDDDIYISVTGDECGAAIGRRGETLDAISYMSNLVANKKTEQRVRVHLDVGGYRKHREQILINLANRAAYKVKKTGRKVVMEKMNPAERRIIHSHLQSVAGVTTHSEGEEPNRRVIVTIDRAEQ